MYSQRVSDGSTLPWRFTSTPTPLPSQVIRAPLKNNLDAGTNIQGQSEVLQSETVAGKDAPRGHVACVKPTGTYSQRVSECSTLLWRITNRSGLDHVGFPGAAPEVIHSHHPS